MAFAPLRTSRFTIRRPEGGVRGFASRAWARWWVKVLAVLAGLAALALFLLWLLVVRDLPSVDQLRTYEPPLPTNVRGIDGTPIQSYARERRVELSLRRISAAADPRVPGGGGQDLLRASRRRLSRVWPGAVVDYVSKIGSGRRAKGGSTITQQVAKNLLIGNEYSPTRKLKEAILAYKIEDTLTKQQILELYLNQIALGRNAFGVEAASHAYFDKELPELSLAQMAYLAILPKGPSNYDPVAPSRARAGAAQLRAGRDAAQRLHHARRSTPTAIAEPLGTIAAPHAQVRARSAAISSRRCGAS